MTRDKNFQGSLNDLRWEIYPEGLYEMITYLKKWKSPVFITENGVADGSDRVRAKFILDQMKQIRRCLDERQILMGYLYWSLVDNYEWHEGYRPEGKFGLFSVDRQRIDLSRVPTRGAEVFKELITESMLSGSSGSNTRFNFKSRGSHT